VLSYPAQHPIVLQIAATGPVQLQSKVTVLLLLLCCSFAAEGGNAGRTATVSWKTIIKERKWKKEIGSLRSCSIVAEQDSVSSRSRVILTYSVAFAHPLHTYPYGLECNSTTHIIACLPCRADPSSNCSRTPSFLLCSFGVPQHTYSVEAGEITTSVRSRSTVMVQ